MADSDARLKALLALLDDPDPSIQAEVDKAILALGEAAIPTLEAYWLQNQDPLVQSRIEALLEDITLDSVSAFLYSWRLEPTQPLWPALLAVSRLHYPSLQQDKYTALYNRLVHKTWLTLPQAADPIEKFSMINSYLFQTERFQAEITRPQHPDYYHIHLLLERKRGNPFSLSVLYYLIARDLDLAGASVVSIQGRYLVRYYDGDLHFYLDPYQQGRFIMPNQIKELLERLAVPANLAHYPSLSHPYIILYLVAHLARAYEEEHSSTSNLYYALLESLKAQFSGGGTSREA